VLMRADPSLDTLTDLAGPAVLGDPVVMAGPARVRTAPVGAART
jgi:hypothetical protein